MEDVAGTKGNPHKKVLARGKRKSIHFCHLSLTTCHTSNIIDSQGFLLNSEEKELEGYSGCLYNSNCITEII